MVPGITGSTVVRVEIIALALAVCVGFVRPRLGSAFFSAVEARGLAIARRPIVSLIAVFAFALGLRLALLPVAPIPVPSANDEFSYLLASDTFAHGRLANPTNPMWEHFESIHIDQRPAYASMYPPVQGLILAAGQVVSGTPWVGILVAMAAMCAAITWMLRGWCSPGWALLGGVLAALRLGTFGYWINSYYGGVHAALGGALVFGALPRIRQHAAPRYAIVLAAGAAILANSRPFEGAIVTGAAAATLVLWMVRQEIPWRTGVRRIALPAVTVLAAAGAWMAYYNWRAFGDPLTLPYSVNRTTYAVTPMFIFQPLKPAPEYRHDEMRRFFTEWEPMSYRYLRTFWGFRHALLDRYGQAEQFFLGPLFLLPLLIFPRSLLEPRIRMPVVTAAALVLMMTTTVWLLPHYLAAITGAVYVLMLEGLRRLGAWEFRGRPTGQFIVRGIVVSCFLSVAFVAGVRALGLEQLKESTYGYVLPGAGLRDRAALIERWSHGPARHLVFVRYANTHNVHKEWVYNEADIESAKVIWAREMTDAENQRLIEHLPDREVWLVEPDVDPVRVTAIRRVTSTSPEP